MDGLDSPAPVVEASKLLSSMWGAFEEEVIDALSVNHQQGEVWVGGVGVEVAYVGVVEVIFVFTLCSAGSPWGWPEELSARAI